MKALTIRQPWISLILAGKKRDEYRSWQTRHRGLIALHAGKSVDSEGIKEYGYAAAPRGSILAIATLTSIRWDAGEQCYAWRLDDIKPLAQPIPWRGQLWLFYVPDDLLDANPPLLVPEVR